MNKTNKTMYWILWTIALIGINGYALPLAIWSTFAGTEEAKWLWIAICSCNFSSIKSRDHSDVYCNQTK